MARRYVAPPAYIQTLQNGGQNTNLGAQNTWMNTTGKGTGVGQYASLNNTGQQTPQSLDAQTNWSNAVREKYAAGASLTADGANGYGYDPKEAAEYARQEQVRFQGGPAVSSAALGQAAYDQGQRSNLQAVGAQRGGGGQSQGLRAAMMGTTGSAQQQTQAGMQATQEQVAQRQAILQQKLQSEAAQREARLKWQDEKSRFEKEKEENDGDTSSGMMKIAGSALGMMSDERAKVKKVKKTRAPSLVIMIGGK